MADERSLKLTDRDGQLLANLARHRYLSISQIQRLHFPSEQTTYRRLRALKEAELVESFSVPGINEAILYLTKEGAEKATACLSENVPAKIISETPKDYYYLKHFLAINDFWIGLRQASQNSPIKLKEFIPDYYGEKTERGGLIKLIRDTVTDPASSEQISHTPDAVFVLEKEGKPALFFLEIDRGTEVVSDQQKGVLKGLRFYLSYLLSGEYQRYSKEFGLSPFKGFRTLFVTTSEERLQNIREASQTLFFPSKAKRFIWLTTFDEIDNEGVFKSKWRSLDLSDENRYQIT